MALNVKLQGFFIGFRIQTLFFYQFGVSIGRTESSCFPNKLEITLNKEFDQWSSIKENIKNCYHDKDLKFDYEPLIYRLKNNMLLTYYNTLWSQWQL